MVSHYLSDLVDLNRMKTLLEGIMSEMEAKIGISNPCDKDDIFQGVIESFRRLSLGRSKG